MTVWQHVFPPFDSWWPNVFAAVLAWVPTLTVHHLLLRRHFRNQLAEKLRDFLDGEENEEPSTLD